MNDEAARILQELVKRYGVAIALDPLRCEGMLRDRCPRCNREIFVLVNAVRQRVPADLLTPKHSLPQALLQGFLKKRLQDELGLSDETAQWAVETWAEALGFSTGKQIKTEIRDETPVIPETPEDPDSRMRRGQLADDLENGSLISRLDAIDGLSLAGSHEDIRILIGALENSEMKVRIAAYDAILSKGSPAVPYLIEALADTRDGIVWRNALLLGALHAKPAVQQLITLLERNGKVRLCTIWALGEIGSDSAVTPLMKLLGDDDPAVAKESAEALKKIGHR